MREKLRLLGPLLLVTAMCETSRPILVQSVPAGNVDQDVHRVARAQRSHRLRCQPTPWGVHEGDHRVPVGTPNGRLIALAIWSRPLFGAPFPSNSVRGVGKMLGCTDTCLSYAAHHTTHAGTRARTHGGCAAPPTPKTNIHSAKKKHVLGVQGRVKPPALANAPAAGLVCLACRHRRPSPLGCLFHDRKGWMRQLIK